MFRSWWQSRRNPCAAQVSGKRGTRRRRTVVPGFDRLEDRNIPSIALNATSWTAIGPAPISGNAELGHPEGRVEVVAADPTDPSVVYLGGDQGGIWRTTNWLAAGGPTWSPRTDYQSSLAVRGYHALVVSPSNHLVVYGAVSGTGGGVLKSTDGGTTWTLLGNATFEGHTISALAVDPTTSDVVYAASDNGVFKSTDGGNTWHNQTPALSGAFTDLVIDPSHHKTLYAGMIELGSSAAGIYKSTDGGQTWTPGPLSNGIISGAQVGWTIALAIAPSSPADIYATVFDVDLGNSPDGHASRFHSGDGGAHWNPLTPTPGTFEDRFWHVVLAVDPQHANIVYVNDAYALYSSSDFGQSWNYVSLDGSGTNFGDDFVGVTFDKNDNVIAFGDRSIYRLDAGQSQWTGEQGNLQTTEFYDITLDPGNPNRAYGVAQDQFDYLQFSGKKEWDYGASGGEAGKVLVDPAATQNLFVSSPLYDPTQDPHPFFVQRSLDGGQTWTTILTPAQTGTQPNDYNLAYATQKSFVMDPNDPNRLFLGTTRVYMTGDAFDQSPQWQPISPVLSPSHNVKSQYITALTVAPSNSHIIYAATADGHIWAGLFNGLAWTWSEADDGLFGTANGPVVDIRVSPTDPQTLFVVTQGSGGKNIWYTFSGGVAQPFVGWTLVSGNFPTNLTPECLFVDWRYSPMTLYVGTDRGLFVCTDLTPPGGFPNNTPPNNHWHRFGAPGSSHAHLPYTEISDLEFSAKYNILAAATYGRGAYEIILPPPPASHFQVTVTGQTLQIVGDASNKQIAIEDMGMAGLMVSLDGGLAQTYTGIDQLMINTGGGNNEVRFLAMAQNLMSLDVHVNFGAGNDTFMLTLVAMGSEGGSDIPPALSFTVQDGNGRDMFDTLLMGVSAPGTVGGIPLFSPSLNIDYVGRKGDDSFVNVFQDVRLGSPVTIHETGRAGHDTFENMFSNLIADAAFSVDTGNMAPRSQAKHLLM